jgi:signal transduction histidine kinase
MTAPGFIRRMDLRWKFIVIVIFIIVSVALLQNLIFYFLEARTITESLKNKVSVLAQVLADNGTPALQFRSRADALELLESLSNEPSVRAGYLFTSDGQLLAEYLAPDEKLSVPLIDGFDRPRLELSAERITVLHPVLLDGKLVGALYMSSDLRELRERTDMRFLLGLATLFGSVALAFALALWCQRFFIEPILYLSRLFHEIGEKKQYTLRARKTSEDELGVLVDSFNAMLEAIRSRDEALALKSRELEYSNKELEQFAYVISHDLKSPLVTIQGFATRFWKHIAEGNRAKAEDAALRVQNAAKRMGELIDDVLELSRVGRTHGDRKAIDPSAEINRLKEDLRGVLDEAGATLVIERNLPAVKADAGEIRQVFQNLISNAIRYACREPGGKITVGGAITGHERRLYVRDQGPGIPREYHAKIFQLFQRLSKEKDGTGLGLAIVAKIMKNLGGRAWVESEEGKGATFWLAFPESPQYNAGGG